VNETRNNVRVLQVEVIMRTIDVGGDDGGEVAAILLMVSVVGDVNHTLGMCIGCIGEVRGTIVDHGLIDGISGLVGEDASRKARDNLLDLVLVRACEDVVVHAEIVVVELNGVLHVTEETTNERGKVNHVGWAVLLKQSLTFR